MDRATSGPVCYSIAILAVAALFGREMWVAYRSSRSVTLSVATIVLTVAAFAIIAVRLISLMRL